jgi:hypothetical protein
MSLLDFGKSEEQTQGFVYTEEQLMARLKFFIGVCLSLTLTGIVFVVLYSLIFVTQPLNAISPIDQKFFELIVPIATFLTGTLSGIMLAGNDKEAQKMALAAATRPTTPSPMPPTPGIAPAFGLGSPMAPTPPTMNFGQMTTAPMQTQMSPSAFSTPAVNINIPAFTPQVTMSSTGKPMPVQPPQPEI